MGSASEADAAVPGPNRRVVSFTTTARASADAHALAWVGLTRLDVVADAGLIFLGLLMFAFGNPVVGTIFIGIAALSLANSRSHWLQRGVTAVRFRSILGQPTKVTVDDEGVRFENRLATSVVPWSSINAVRTNKRTVAFFRDRVLMGYIPSIAFESPAAQEEVAAFARSRIGPVTVPSGSPGAPRRGR